jgi:DNA-binding IclR family transcriptional regulator
MLGGDASARRNVTGSTDPVLAPLCGGFDMLHSFPAIGYDPRASFRMRCWRIDRPMHIFMDELIIHIRTIGRQACPAPVFSLSLKSYEPTPTVKTAKPSKVGENAPEGALDEAERYRAPALDKGLDILELLSEQKDGLTRAEIMKALGRNASEIYRMLERLVARQYVVRSAGGDRYSLSLKLFALAHRHPPINRFIAAALPVMQAFAEQAEQSCHLTVYDRGNLLVIAQVDGPGTWGLSIRLGSRVGLIDTASGQVMLAFQNELERERMLAEHTKVKGEIALGGAALASTFAAIRERGHLRKDSAQTFGVTDVTFPILGPSGHAVAALTTPYMRRIDEYIAPSLDDVTTMLDAAAHKLSMHERPST